MIAVAFKPRTMNALSALRIGIDATDIGITSGERGGVYQYILHLHRHVAAVSPDSDLRPMFALPHYRHGRAIRQCARQRGSFQLGELGGAGGRRVPKGAAVKDRRIRVLEVITSLAGGAG